MVKKFLALVFAFALSLSVATTAFAAVPQNAVATPGETEAKYEVNTYFYEADGINADYYFVIPAKIEINGSDNTTAAKTGTCTITGVNETDVTLTADTTVTVQKQGGSLDATANVTLDPTSVVLPASITAEQTASGTISASFPVNAAPLAKGVYTGTIAYHVG